MPFQFYPKDEIFSKQIQGLIGKLGAFVADENTKNFQTYLHGSRIWMHAELSKRDITPERKKLLEAWLKDEAINDGPGVSLPDTDCVVLFPGLPAAELYRAKGELLKYNKAQWQQTVICAGLCRH